MHLIAAARLGRELADFARHYHFAAGLLGKSEHLRQAKPGALADFLGGEERLEDPPELVFRDSDTGIGDRYGHVTIRSLGL